MREYDLIADRFHASRDPGIGVAEVTAFARALGPGARVLDVGCGTGEPITTALLAAGCRVVVVDSSREMLIRFRRHLPHVPAVRAVVEACPFRDRSFDGVVAWGVLFHLDRAGQAGAIAHVSRLLKPGSPFLFTAGDEDGEVHGEMHGVPFRYVSFSIDGYRALLRDHGLSLVEHHVDAHENRHYLARKEP
ncbi:MAG TPA: class I SAM-dependent methyltransferase [Vicinamibacterales bacterium]